MDIQSKNVKSRSYRDQLIDVDLQTLAEAVENITPSPSSYKVYTALLTQKETDAPVATVLENTIGKITYAYISQGLYSLTADYPIFLDDKTFYVPIMSIQNNLSGDLVMTSFIKSSDTHFVIESSRYPTPGGRENQLLYNISIEIRVYN